MKKTHFLAADFEKRKKEQNLNSPNLLNITKGTLILKDWGIASYPCSNYGVSKLLFRFINSCKVLDLRSLWKSMKFWELLISDMKSGGFFIRYLAKAVRNRQSEQNEKLKTSVLDGPSYQIQRFSKLHFCYGSKSLAKITHFNINTGVKFPKLGRN